MPTTARSALRASVIAYLIAGALDLPGTVFAETTDATKTAPQVSHASRSQLSIGYSLLFEEANGIPKLKWILLFKDKSEAMGQVTQDLVRFYEHLAQTMERLAKEYPAMKLDAQPMSEIEAKTRKAIGADLAKGFAPIIGNAGIQFERAALLMFFNSLDEQRHLTGVMLELETDSGLRKFLETTQSQLQEQYLKVETLLNRRYFTH